MDGPNGTPEPRVGDVLPPLVKALSQRRIDAYSGVRPGSIHTDADWARRKGFRLPLAQGMMSTAYVSELMVGLLGRGFVEGGRMDVTFLDPVYADDVLTVAGVVSDVAADGAEEGGGGRVTVTVRATNADGATTMAGTASGTVGVRQGAGAAGGPEGGHVDAGTPLALAASNRGRIGAPGAERFRRLTYDALVVGEEFASDDRLIRPQDLETYAFAVDDHHPWFTVGDDPQAPVDSPYGEPIAHPTLLGNQALFLRHTRYVVPAGLHAKMSFEFLRPVRLGRRVRSRGRVVEKYERRGRQFMVTEFVAADETAEPAAPLLRGRFTQMLLPEEGITPPAP
jgi:3-hydroxybutyryl-CoA dehydratase